MNKKTKRLAILFFVGIFFFSIIPSNNNIDKSLVLNPVSSSEQSQSENLWNLIVNDSITWSLNDTILDRDGQKISQSIAFLRAIVGLTNDLAIDSDLEQDIGLYVKALIPIYKNIGVGMKSQDMFDNLMRIYISLVKYIASAYETGEDLVLLDKDPVIYFPVSQDTAFSYLYSSFWSGLFSLLDYQDKWDGYEMSDAYWNYEISDFNQRNNSIERGIFTFWNRTYANRIDIIPMPNRNWTRGMRFHVVDNSSMDQNNKYGYLGYQNRQSLPEIIQDNRYFYRYRFFNNNTDTIIVFSEDSVYQNMSMSEMYDVLDSQIFRWNKTGFYYYVRPFFEVLDVNGFYSMSPISDFGWNEGWIRLFDINQIKDGWNIFDFRMDYSNAHGPKRIRLRLFEDTNPKSETPYEEIDFPLTQDRFYPMNFNFLYNGIIVMNGENGSAFYLDDWGDWEEEDGNLFMRTTAQDEYREHIDELAEFSPLDLLIFPNEKKYSVFGKLEYMRELLRRSSSIPDGFKDFANEIFKLDDHYVRFLFNNEILNETIGQVIDLPEFRSLFGKIRYDLDIKINRDIGVLENAKLVIEYEDIGYTQIYEMKVIQSTNSRESQDGYFAFEGSLYNNSTRRIWINDSYSSRFHNDSIPDIIDPSNYPINVQELLYSNDFIDQESIAGQIIEERKGQMIGAIAGVFSISSLSGIVLLRYRKKR